MHSHNSNKAPRTRPICIERVFLDKYFLLHWGWHTALSSNLLSASLKSYQTKAPAGKIDRDQALTIDVRSQLVVSPPCAGSVPEGQPAPSAPPSPKHVPSVPSVSVQLLDFGSTGTIGTQHYITVSLIITYSPEHRSLATHRLQYTNSKHRKARGMMPWSQTDNLRLSHRSPTRCRRRHDRVLEGYST